MVCTTGNWQGAQYLLTFPTRVKDDLRLCSNLDDVGAPSLKVSSVSPRFGSSFAWFLIRSLLSEAFDLEWYAIVTAREQTKVAVVIYPAIASATPKATSAFVAMSSALPATTSLQQSFVRTASLLCRCSASDLEMPNLLSGRTLDFDSSPLIVKSHVLSTG